VTGDADLSTDNGRLYARIKGAVGKSEVERKSARQRAACKQRAESGRAWLARRAFGYTKPNRDGTGMRVIESEASLLRDAYAAVLAGRSLRGIAADWNANGVRTTEGNPWVGVVLRKALVNPRYAGLRSYRGEIVGAADWPQSSTATSLTPCGPNWPTRRGLTGPVTAARWAPASGCCPGWRSAGAPNAASR
jgi:hypothetical protein